MQCRSVQTSPPSSPFAPPKKQPPPFVGLAIPKGSLILVTGANSFLGMHIVDQLLEHGYRVRGTVRDETKAALLWKYFTDRHGVVRFTKVVVPDMSAEDAFKEAIKDCKGVVHCAAVTQLNPDPDYVITPTIAGALNLLDAASVAGVQRFVFTSGVASAVSHDREEVQEVSCQTWNMPVFNEAWAPAPYSEEKLLAVRDSMKLQTEAAVWRWYVLKFMIRLYEGLLLMHEQV